MNKRTTTTEAGAAGELEEHDLLREKDRDWTMGGGL